MAKKKNSLTLLDALKKQAASLPSLTARMPTFFPPPKQVPKKYVGFDLGKNAGNITAKATMKYQGISFDIESIDIIDESRFVMSQSIRTALSLKMQKQKDFYESMSFMPSSLKAYEYGRDSKMTPGQKLRDEISKHRHYLRAETLPWANPEYDPEFLASFTWGPLGEWINAPINEDYQSKLYYEMRHRSTMTGYVPISDYGFTAHPLRDEGGRAHTILLQYSNYNTMRSHAEGDSRGMDARDVSRLLAGLLQRGMIDVERLNEWFLALKSGKFASGFGVLRDGDDHYDAFGVLAYINGANWEWSDHEGAYVLSGHHKDPTRLDTETMSVYLGIPSEVPDRFLKTMINLVITESDTQESFFKPIIDIIESASKIVNKRIADLASTLRDLPSRSYMQKTEIWAAPRLCVSKDMDMTGPSAITISERDLKVDPLSWRDFKAKYE